MEALFFYLVFIGIAGWMPAKWNSGRKAREPGRRLRAGGYTFGRARRR